MMSDRATILGITVKLPLWKNIPELWHGIALRWWVKEVGSIFTHGAWIAAMVAPPSLWGMHWWTAAWVALALCLVRELVEQWPIERWWDTVYDTAVFMTVAALTAGFLTGWTW